MQSKSYTLDQIKDELIGPIGQIDRDTYEFELKMELLGEMIKKARLERKSDSSRIG